ncbi:MAG: ribosome biogenesis GTPase Der [Chloroflexota bacterium]
MAKPIVAIVGRPNVGKSTLFNRIVGQRLAIVADEAGTTRDRLYADAAWEGRDFTIVDTGGLTGGTVDEFASRVEDQAQLAIDEADVIVLLGDAIDGVTAADEEVAAVLRRTSKPVLLAINKADSEQRRLAAVDFYSMGLGDPLPLSSIHGVGVAELLDEVVAHLPEAGDEEEAGEMPRLAIVGRPNVGKSSLINALLGQERMIVDQVPGTTRDAIDSVIEYQEQNLLLIDTAGIRRRGHVEQGVEKYSVMRALRALGRADVALLVVDADEGLTAQDTHVASYVVDAGKGVVIVVNKWDLITRSQTAMADYTQLVRERFKFLAFAPVVFVSALRKQRLNTMLDAALRVHTQRQRRVTTAQLNQVITEAEAAHPAPSQRGRRLKIFYCTQTTINPPTFVFFTNEPKLLHFSYERYLENRLRAEFGFEGTPLRFIFRGRPDERKEE